MLLVSVYKDPVPCARDTEVNWISSLPWAVVEQWGSGEFFQEVRRGASGDPRGHLEEEHGWCLQLVAPTPSPALVFPQEDICHGCWEQDLHRHVQAVPAVQSAGEAPPGGGMASLPPSSEGSFWGLPGLPDTLSWASPLFPVEEKDGEGSWAQSSPYASDQICPALIAPLPHVCHTCRGKDLPL